jgi:hypothetical protein
MGLSESPTPRSGNQRWRKRTARRPRARRCLLKGCDQPFRPRQARQRYCSAACRESARRWSRWKAQQRYRETAAGQQKRNGQSRRYRERVKSRKTEPEAINDPARVITTEHFFSTVRVTGRAATRESRERGEVPCSTSVRTRAGARWSASGNGSGAGNRRGFKAGDIDPRRRWPYIQPVGCNWSFTSSIVDGSTCEYTIRDGSGGYWRRWQREASRRPLWWSWPMARQTVTW